LYNRQSENINNPSLLYLAVSIERDLFFKRIMGIEILEIKIDNLNIDLSDKVYYYAKVKKNKQNFILQMVTDGIINHHLDLKQWKDYVINKMNY